MDKIVLPDDFDGVFRFTNPTNEAFTAKWNGKAYTFPPMKTSPMIITDATPVEVQSIRKKFAKELAEHEFFKGDEAKRLQAIERNGNGPALNSIHQANTYSLDNLQKMIQKCLDPLPVERASVEAVDKPDITEQLSKDEEGELRTQAVDRKISLKKKALEA